MTDKAIANHLTNLLNTFDEMTYIRGMEYYQQDLVEYYRVEQHNRKIIIHAEVLGNFLYEQTIAISLDSLFVDGECDCPVGYNCKHVVAAILKVREKFSNNKHTKGFPVANHYQNWLQLLKGVETQKQDVRLHQEHFLVYRLFLEGSGSLVSFHKAKWLKSGKISKGTKLSAENLFYSYSYRYDFLSHEDKEIIPLLDNLAENYRKDVDFQGILGTVALKKMVATQRTFYKDAQEPLTLSQEKKRLSFVWKEQEGGMQLFPNLEGEYIIFHKTEPMLYIDVTHNRLVEIESDISPMKVALLLDAPIIPKKEIGKVIQTLAQQLPQESVAMPQGFEVEQFQTDVVPDLLLYAQQVGERKVHCMELQFLYGDYAFECQSSESYIFGDEKTVEVQRDFAKEQACKETMEALGFTYEPHLKAYISTSKGSLQEAIERWRIFVDEKVETLRQEGWQIEIDESFGYAFEYSDAIFADVEEDDTNSWFTLSFKVDVGGKKLDLLPIVVPLLEEFDTIESLPPRLNLQLPNGNYLHIKAEEVKPILQTLYELFDGKSDSSELVVKPYDAHLLEMDGPVEYRGAKELQALAKKLKDFSGIEPIEPSPNLQASLRPYQKEGISWLNFLHTFGFGGILADDMGLGKTIQTLAYLQILKERGELTKPSLVVMPTSLIGNWKSEIAKFTPNLTYLELYGTERAEAFEKIADHDIILTTYSLIVRDSERYEALSFAYVILDEAQKIKNPKTKMARSIKSLQTTHRLALTGTPIENHLGELWSIFDFVMPGFLGNLHLFRELFQNPIEKEKLYSKQTLLNRKIAPFILRRTKEAVVKELPPKTEIIKKVTFSPKEAALYENIRVAMEKKLRDAIKQKGLNKSHIMILDALLKLRQVCCHPKLLKLKAAESVKEASKLEMFMELIETLMAEGKKVLVFSQFTQMLTIMEEQIKAQKIPYTKLTGATRKREEAIAKFTQGDANIFLISLKAGGVGLNLVEADTVIHYDPWWNPAVENQATDRAYRIGQDKAVFVYKLVVENSIEEKIIALQEKKRSISEGIYEQKEQESLRGEELLALLSL